MESGWNFGLVDTCDLIDDIKERLEGCGKAQLKWSSAVFPNNKKAIEALMNEVSALRRDGLEVNMKRRIDDITVEIERLWELEEKYWGQQARLNWLSFGDHNTRFFHATTVQRRQRNRVTRIKNEDGQWLEDEGLIGDCFGEFFSQLFASSGDRDLSLALSFVEPKIDAGMNADLLKEVSLKEVKDAIFQLGKDKALGLGGFSGWFFQHSWDITGGKDF